MWTIEVKADKCSVCGGEIECSERVNTLSGPAHLCHFEVCSIVAICYIGGLNVTKNVQDMRDTTHGESSP